MPKHQYTEAEWTAYATDQYEKDTAAGTASGTLDDYVAWGYEQFEKLQEKRREMARIDRKASKQPAVEKENEVVFTQVQASSSTAPRLTERAAHFEYVMPWGKHLGKSLRYLVEKERGYITWLAKNTVCPPPLPLRTGCVILMF